MTKIAQIVRSPSSNAAITSALVRDRARAADLVETRIELVLGDLLKADSLAAAVSTRCSISRAGAARETDLAPAPWADGPNRCALSSCYVSRAAHFEAGRGGTESPRKFR